MSDLIIFDNGYLNDEEKYIQTESFYEPELSIQFARKDFETEEAYWDMVRMWHPAVRKLCLTGHLLQPKILSLFASNVLHFV